MSSPAPAPRSQPSGTTRLGSIGGVPLLMSNSWPWGLVLIAVIYGSSMAASGLAPVEIVLLVVMLIVLQTISVVLHEGAHAATARAVGDEVTSITFALWGGYTQIATFRPKPWKHAATAIAGPLTNLLLAGLAAMLDSTLPLGQVAHLVLVTFQWMNLFLGIFNILPGLPMDGGQVVEAGVWGATGSRAKGLKAGGWAGRVVALGVAAWYLAPLATGRPFDAGTIWMLFVALFLWQGASRVLRSAEARQSLDGATIADASWPGHLVPSTVTLGEALQRADGDVAILVDGTTLVGIVPPKDADPGLLHLPAVRFSMPCRPAPLDLTPETAALDVVMAMETEGQEVVIGRYPTGEPRVVTAAMVVNALNRAQGGQGAPTQP